MNRKNIVIICSSIGIIMILTAIFLYFNSNKNYVVTFDTNGGNNIVSQKVKEGNTIVKPNNPIKTGYDFVGWYYNNTKYDFSSKVYSDIKLVALWKEKIDEQKNIYTVTFDSDGGSIVESQKVNENSICIEPLVPTKNGYTFDGWYLDDIKYDFSQVVTKNITLKAKWKELKSNNNLTTNTNDNSNSNSTKNNNQKSNYYKVSFDGNGGKSLQFVYVESGNKVKNPGETVRDGYKFTGWTLNGVNYDFNTPVTKDIVLLASWKKIYHVICSTENYYNKQDVVAGEKAVRPPDPEIPGAKNISWVDCSTNNIYNFNEPVNQDINLCIYYTKSE